MATRKMTFTLPENLASKFVKKVRARDRSRYLAEALAHKLAERDRQLLRACQIANEDPEVQAIEKELNAIPEESAELWAHTAARRGLVGPPRSHTRRGN